MLTEQQLAAIKARADAATRGPWVEGHGTEGWQFIPTSEIHAPFADNEGYARIAICRYGAERNLPFLVHAREDIPALLDEIRRLRAGLEAAKMEHVLPSSYLGQSYCYLWQRVQEHDAAIDALLGKG